MNISIKICDLCDTCVYSGEYEIVDEDVICVMCLEEEQEEGAEDEISSRSVGAV
jgi:formylmethanofuran dehydrogenase subunit E|tara:strand:+ start:374 stop:535 length:162 start_codon:yes stop_codon:yes gene_type:complete